MKKLLLSLAAAAVVLPAGSALAVPEDYEGMDAAAEKAVTETRDKLFEEWKRADKLNLSDKQLNENVEATIDQGLDKFKKDAEKIVAKQKAKDAAYMQKAVKKALPKTSAVK